MFWEICYNKINYMKSLNIDSMGNDLDTYAAVRGLNTKSIVEGDSIPESERIPTIRRQDIANVLDKVYTRDLYFRD